MWIDKLIPEGHPLTGSRLSLEKTAGLLSEKGYNGIEIMIGDPSVFDYREVQNIVSKYNLEVSQLCTGEFWGTYNLCLNDINEIKAEKALDWAEKVINLAGFFNCSINIGRFRGKIWQDGFENSIGRMINSFKYLDKKAQEQNVKILIEPLREDICDNLNYVSEAYDIIKKHKLQSFSIMIDTDHTSIEEKDSIQSYSNSIKYIHLADTKHVPLGDGIVPFSEYFNLIQSIGYDGYVGIEVFSDNQDEDIIKSSITYLKKFIYKEEEHWHYKDIFEWIN